MKHAIVTPIIKKRGLDVNVYYRLISSLSVLSKTLERYFALELRRYLDDKCLNDPFQSAYRPGHSTDTALVRIHNDLLLSVDSRHSVLLVLLDPTAAFDTLDHTILLNRLRELGVDRTVLAWFTSYLIGRSNSVKIRQTTSSRQTLKYGVPQGSVLGPILYNIYISPIADIIQTSSNPLPHLRRRYSTVCRVSAIEPYRRAPTITRLCGRTETVAGP